MFTDSFTSWRLKEGLEERGKLYQIIPPERSQSFDFYQILLFYAMFHNWKEEDRNRMDVQAYLTLFKEGCTERRGKIIPKLILLKGGGK